MKDQIRHAQLDYIFEQLRITAWPHALGATITAAGIWMDNPGYPIVIWFLLIHLSHLLRFYLVDRRWYQSKQKGESYLYMPHWLVGGMLLRGFMWSLIPAYFMSEVGTEIFIFCTIALAGVLCATLPALAGYLPAYLAFALPILLALSVRHYTLGLESTAGLVVMMAAAVVGISHVLNQIITRSITMFFENQALLQEVTQARDDAELASLDKSRFLAFASHDLRQPLQGLGLTLESIRLRLNKDWDEQSPKVLRDLIHQSQHSHHALSTLLNSLLELSQLESRNIEVHRCMLDLKSIIEPIVHEFKSSAEQKELLLEVDIIPVSVMTDAVLLGRIARNLLNNAIKFTSTGSITIRTNLKNDFLELSVFDTGIGIPAAELKNIFKEYHQLANSVRNSNDGIGLGLSVVKKMCDILGHDIVVKSTLNFGSCFTLRIAIADVETDSQDALVAQDNSHSGFHEIDAATISGLTVLLIDDDNDALSGMKALLNEWGNQCVLAKSLQQALDQLADDNAIDVILSDYRLPDNVDGTQVIQTINEYLGRRVPALLVSGETDPADVARIKNHGIPLLRKPVNPIELSKTIREVCDGYVAAV